MILFAAVFTACGAPAQPPESVEPESATLVADAGDASDPEQGAETISDAKGGCPATMKEAKGSCLTPAGEKIPTLCKYPEGKCKCGPPKHCGGMPPDPVIQEQWVWTCKSPPPDVLPDGCPGKLPEPGAPCDDEGKVCWHGSCCTQKLECSMGKWLVGDLKCPP